MRESRFDDEWVDNKPAGGMMKAKYTTKEMKGLFTS